MLKQDVSKYLPADLTGSYPFRYSALLYKIPLVPGAPFYTFSSHPELALQDLFIIEYVKFYLPSVAQLPDKKNFIWGGNFSISVNHAGVFKLPMFILTRRTKNGYRVEPPLVLRGFQNIEFSIYVIKPLEKCKGQHITLTLHGYLVQNAVSIT